MTVKTAADFQQEHSDARAFAELGFDAFDIEEAARQLAANAASLGVSA